MNFGEKAKEYSRKQGKEIPVWKSPKYEESKKKAVEIINQYDDIMEGDFWILMNETKNGKMAYTGLIISHNGCLKINDHLSDELKFKPECVTVDSHGWQESLVYSYCCPEQGLYEVGEVSKTNCKNEYPHAMALKRCYDRVVLKNCKLAYSGVYSDSEAEEFRRPDTDVDAGQLVKDLLIAGAKHGFDKKRICQMLKVESLTELTVDRLQKGVEYFEKMEVE